MRPDLLPPLVIPKRRSPPPILVASHAQHLQQQVERPFRPSYHSLSPRVLPSRPPELKLDDIDDIDVFNFYNPCLLPPSPIRPFPARAHTDPTAGLPAPPPYSRDPPPPEPAPGLRRSTYTMTRRGRDNNARRSNYVAIFPPARSRSPSPPRADPEREPVVSPLSIQRSPSPFYARPPPPIPPRLRPRPVTLPQWDASGPHFEASRPPSPAVAPHPQPFAPPPWDASSSIYSVHTDVPSIYIHDEGHDSSRGSSEEEEDEEYTTPYLAVRPDSRLGLGREGDQEREQLALRELWGVIDGMLGPGKNLKDYDSNSFASSMDDLAKAAGSWDGIAKQDSSQSDQSMYGEATWWRAFRQGLLLS
ncbi:uncharacterized protein B0H64DRAFT_447783 [Chaetomium fimeti]|uniref:Uncharacterized protein n=1 Tax=Chaetomium fimeti TaxID=1854472 RepID=A0AAE0LW63_9PEZI|nr:hypothetical protein B0H64DRAFT_447783 [Chaetomium fimeti]